MVHFIDGEERARYLFELFESQIRNYLVTASDSEVCSGLIANGATDCSTREQIFLCMRCYNDRDKGALFKLY